MNCWPKQTMAFRYWVQSHSCSLEAAHATPLSRWLSGICIKIYVTASLPCAVLHSRQWPCCSPNTSTVIYARGQAPVSHVSLTARLSSWVGTGPVMGWVTGQVTGLVTGQVTGPSSPATGWVAGWVIGCPLRLESCKSNLSDQQQLLSSAPPSPVPVQHSSCPQQLLSSVPWRVVDMLLETRGDQGLWPPAHQHFSVLVACCPSWLGVGRGTDRLRQAPEAPRSRALPGSLGYASPILLSLLKAVLHISPPICSQFHHTSFFLLDPYPAELKCVLISWFQEADH